MQVLIFLGRKLLVQYVHIDGLEWFEFRLLVDRGVF